MRKIIFKLITIIVLSIGILFALFILSFSLFIPLANNYIANKQEKVLAQIDLPENTYLIEKQSVCGKLNGNGNGINYLATILIKSDLSLVELQDYYSNYEVMEQNSNLFESEYLEHDSISYDMLDNITEFNGYYVVYSYKSADFGSIWEFDIRGH